MFKDILYALKVELKNVIYKSWFHFIRFGGLLIIPFIYGFSYIFAFYDPFPNVNQLKVSVITDSKANDPFGNALGEELKEASVKIGDLHMTMNMDHIYSGTDAENEKVKKDSFASIKVDNLNGAVVKALKGAMNIGTKITGLVSNPGSFVSTVLKDIQSNLPHIEVSPNYKKNYLIAFGVDVGTAMQGTYATAIHEAVNALNSPDFLNQVVTQDMIDSNIFGTGSTLKVNDPVFTQPEIDKIQKFVADVNKLDIKDFEAVKLTTNMSEHSKYGFGLAPFFICVSMWVGGMVMTFAVHRKIYDTTVTPGHRYFAKWLLITWGTVVQATILMASLYFIGFKQLGIEHWGAMYGFTIIIGMVFAANIQAIRFIIQSRNLGMFLIIILLVLQMASGGGLFPIQTQTGFYHVMNIILPMSKGINIIQEASYQTDWTVLFNQLGYLFIYLLGVPLGVVVNHYRIVSYYLEHNIPLPPKTLRHLNRRSDNKQAVVSAAQNATVVKVIKDSKTVEVMKKVEPIKRIKKHDPVKRIKRRREGDK